MNAFHLWMNVPAPGFYNDLEGGDKSFISGDGCFEASSVKGG
jgi:hypothetical protein